MKKTYKKPVLTTEQFDVADVITVSEPAVEPEKDIPDANNNWQVPVGIDFH